MTAISQLREACTERNLEGILIVSGHNRRYLTGFTGTAGVVLITSQAALLLTDFRYVQQATAQAKDFEVLQYTGSYTEELARLVERFGLKTIGYEEDHMTCGQFRTYQSVPVEWVPTTGLVEQFRMVKTPEEIGIIRTAAEIADAAFAHVVKWIRPGVTELEVSNELEFFMRKQGATSSAFDIIIASGHRGALPHGVASSKVIEAGEMVTMDFGALYQGYRSDMTRTLALGEPTAELKKIYEIVWEAERRGVAGLKPGMTSREADALTREYITEQGYGAYYQHGTGHGIGLEIHENPFLDYRRKEFVLESGMVITVEPGIYLPGVGGVRIEDDVLLTAEGYEVLTHSPKELLIL